MDSPTFGKIAWILLVPRHGSTATACFIQINLQVMDLNLDSHEDEHIRLTTLPEIDCHKL